MAETQDVRRDSGLPTAKNGNGGELEDVLTGGAVFKIAALDDTREQGSAEDHCELHGINIVRDKSINIAVHSLLTREHRRNRYTACLN